MSNGSSAALALGLGVAGGAAIWYLTRDAKRPSGETPKGEAPNSNTPAASTPALAAPPSAPSVGPPPPRVSGPCSLKVDKSGLMADGESVDIATAVERCKAAGKVEWIVLPDAPSAIVVELANALSAAKLPVTMKK
ncbi:MAG: hypothetical protein K8M05_16115 [Deltaproteobacteria bacterium]|nr:hypothetical protein [Kofleriaceae bacterium]